MSSIASVVTKTITKAASASVSPTPTVRATPQGGVLEGGDPSHYDPKNPIILFIIQVRWTQHSGYEVSRWSQCAATSRSRERNDQISSSQTRICDTMKISVKSPLGCSCYTMRRFSNISSTCALLTCDYRQESLLFSADYCTGLSPSSDSLELSRKLLVESYLGLQL
jgi:hypothetical protein